MLTARIIPCLDCKGGRVVKGVRFAGLRDAGSPVELAAAYEAQGADEIVILDVAATPEGRFNQLEVVERVRAVLSLPLTVGGGVRSENDVSALLQAGADKVAVNTAAVANPALLSEIADRYGSQCAVLAIDARERDLGGWEVVVHSGANRTGLDAVSWAKEAVARGAGEILLTSWDRDGTRTGYDLALIRAISDAVQIPIVASGGAASPSHLVEAFRAGASALLAASMFHDGDATVASVKQFLSAKGIWVRS